MKGEMLCRLEHNVPSGRGVPPEAHSGVRVPQHCSAGGDAAIAVQQGGALLFPHHALLDLQLEHAVRGLPT